MVLAVDLYMLREAPDSLSEDRYLYV
jgi:hypothetical protein